MRRGISIAAGVVIITCLLLALIISHGDSTKRIRSLESQLVASRGALAKSNMVVKENLNSYNIQTDAYETENTDLKFKLAEEAEGLSDATRKLEEVERELYNTKTALGSALYKLKGVGGDLRYAKQELKKAELTIEKINGRCF